MDKSDKKVAVHFAEGFEEIEAISIIDVLRRANIDTIMVSVTNRRMVKGSHDITITCDTVFEEINYSDIDFIVLPGGMPGASNLNAHEGLRKEILEFNSKGKNLAAICAAPMVFGNLGLLENMNAVSYPGFEKYLKGANIKDSLVVESGLFITAKGPGAATQFALKIVEQIKGLETAELIKKAMLIND